MPMPVVLPDQREQQARRRFNQTAKRYATIQSPLLYSANQQWQQADDVASRCLSRSLHTTLQRGRTQL